MALGWRDEDGGNVLAALSTASFTPAHPHLGIEVWEGERLVFVLKVCVDVFVLFVLHDYVQRG